MSSIANLTAAEKRAITIAAKAEKERQEQVALQAETRDGRKAKKEANQNAVWNIDQRATRKRTSSTTQVSEKPKKAKETQSVDKGYPPENAETPANGSFELAGALSSNARIMWERSRRQVAAVKTAGGCRIPPPLRGGLRKGVHIGGGAAQRCSCRAGAFSLAGGGHENSDGVCIAPPGRSRQTGAVCVFAFIGGGGRGIMLGWAGASALRR
ncbi:hypothetical protein B0H13DRAFT_2323152 [Mycena leptocephala]|nr:hypothetical protein B0H13DRAFT_2323152 [Mycena leptocephala]